MFLQGRVYLLRCLMRFFYEQTTTVNLSFLHFFFQIVDDEICEVESVQTNKSETDVKDDCTQDDFTALQASNPDEIVEVQLVVICCMLCYYTVLYV